MRPIPNSADSNNFTLDVILTPAEFASLAQRDLQGATCVVFDILRATTSIVTAIAHGAVAVLPVIEIADALAVHSQHPDVLLAGERDGIRIQKALTHSIDFDLGNSPREFTRERVRGRRIVTTTTNGTRALQACATCPEVLATCFGNLEATAQYIEARGSKEILMVCSGTGESLAFEDLLAAGALVVRLSSKSRSSARLSDAALTARDVFLTHEAQIQSALEQSQNGNRLMRMPDLAPDVKVCASRDIYDLVVRRMSDGWLAGRPAAC